MSLRRSHFVAEEPIQASVNSSQVTVPKSSEKNGTLWLFNIAIENDPFIDDFPIETSIYKGFRMAMLNNQMVDLITGCVHLVKSMCCWITKKCAKKPAGIVQTAPQSAPKHVRECTASICKSDFELMFNSGDFVPFYLVLPQHRTQNLKHRLHIGQPHQGIAFPHRSQKPQPWTTTTRGAFPGHHVLRYPVSQAENVFRKTVDGQKVCQSTHLLRVQYGSNQ